MKYQIVLKSEYLIFLSQKHTFPKKPNTLELNKSETTNILIHIVPMNGSQYNK